MRPRLNPFSFLVISLAGWLNQSQHQIIEYLIEENCVLREQIGRRRLRFTDNQRRRLAAKAIRLGRKVLAQIATIVTPETLLAWHRKLIANKYDGSALRTAGRPRKSAEISNLVVQMAEENRGWGYLRLRGALANLGHTVARTPIANILIWRCRPTFSAYTQRVICFPRPRAADSLTTKAVWHSSANLHRATRDLTRFITSHYQAEAKAYFRTLPASSGSVQNRAFQGRD